VIATVAAPERLVAAAEQEVDLGAVDAALVEVATSPAHARLAGVVRYYRDALEPDGPEPDPTELRRLSLTRHDDGWISFRGQLDAVGGERLQAALESIVQAARPRGAAHALPAAGRRPRPALRQRPRRR
jgi:hypothetical protein